MLTFPSIDPVLFRLGPWRLPLLGEVQLAVRWYGLMYLGGFLAGWLLARRLAPRRGLHLSEEQLSDLVLHVLAGVILGGRLGYCLFYNPSYYLSHPLKLLAVWEGGMSFHGGALGVVIAALLFCFRFRCNPLALGDVLATVTTVGLGLGRIANFINGELWGRVTTVPWGMVFPGAGALPRHPSQLYEALLEGPVLLALLWWLCRPTVRRGIPTATFFLAYGVFRLLVEFVREPDAQLGYLWAGATMGQLLSLPMILAGGLGLLWLRRRPL